MKKRIGMFAVAAIAAAIMGTATGCQSITRVEYYEPTKENAEYSTPRTDATQGHGPVKAIEGKSGVPDFSDNKTFRFNLNILGL